MITTSSQFAARYDEAIFRRQTRGLYGGTGYYNIGYWSDRTDTLADACAALVERHLIAAETIGQQRCATVLDVGSGLGEGTAIIAARWKSATVVGVNISARQLAYARERFPQCQWLASDATSMAFADRSADRIISVEAAFHFRSRESFLREAFRVLRPGGSLVLSDVVFAEPERVGDWWIGDGSVLATLQDYLDLCRKTGFSIREASDITRETWHGFCEYLRRRKHWGRIADRIEPAVRSHFLVALERDHAA